MGGIPPLIRPSLDSPPVPCILASRQDEELHVYPPTHGDPYDARRRMMSALCTILLWLACTVPEGGDTAAVEACNAIDDDGDGAIDEDFDKDADGAWVCEGRAAAPDCNDLDPRLYPGALELCDGLDNDCDGEVDTDALGQLEGTVRFVPGYGPHTKLVIYARDGFTDQLRRRSASSGVVLRTVGDLYAG